MIKDFKRVISMILVVAMLASFAGIPGMPSIVAQAAETTSARTTTSAAKNYQWSNRSADGYYLQEVIVDGKTTYNRVNSYGTGGYYLGKPNGSFAGTNKASLDVPRILYSNGSTIVKSVTANNTTYSGLDTTLSVTVPAGVMAKVNSDTSNDMFVRLNIINVDFTKETSEEEILYVYGVKDLDPYSSGLNDSSNNVIHKAVNSASGTYTENDDGTYTVTFDLEGRASSLYAAGYMMYRIDYIIMHDQFTVSKDYESGDGIYGDGVIKTSELGIESIPVMYSQYALSVVLTPDFRAVYNFLYPIGEYTNDKNDSRASFIFLDQEINFFKILKNNPGVAIETSFRSNINSFSAQKDLDGNGSYEATTDYGVPFDSVSKTGYGLTAKIASGFAGKGRKYGSWSPNGYNYGTGNSDSITAIQSHMPEMGASVGAKIYFDNSIYSTNTSTKFNFDIITNFKDGNVTGTGTAVYNSLNNFYEGFFDKTSAKGPAYENQGSGFYSSGYSNTLLINPRESASWSNTIATLIQRTSTANIVPGSGWDNRLTGTKENNYEVVVSGVPKLFNIANVFASDYEGDGGRASSKGGPYGGVGAVGTNYHIDLIPVDRSNSRNYIDAVLSANYIKDEMDETWWTQYRNSVLFAYYNMGSLNSVAEPLDLKGFDVGSDHWYGYENKDANGVGKPNIYDPIYKCVNYDVIFTAIANNAAYEKGYSNGFTINPGSGWEAFNDNTKGSGAYFYTADTWAAFAEARNKAFILAQACCRSSTGYEDSRGLLDVRTQDKANYAVFCHLQYEIDQAAKALNEAREALVLKTMSEYVDDDGNTYAQLNQGVQANLDELSGSVPLYLIAEDGTLKTNATITKYNITDLTAKYNNVTAIGADKTIAEYEKAYEKAIQEFNTEYNNTKASKFNTVSEEGWNAIFTRLSGLAGITITEQNILANFDDLYVDDSNDTVYNKLDTITENYGKISKASKAAEKQGEINTQVEALYNLLTGTSLPSADITSAAAAVRTEMAKTFVAYNPFDFNKYTYPRSEDDVLAEGEIDYSNPLYAWADDSVNNAANKHNGLSAANHYADDSIEAMAGYLETAANANSYNLWNTTKAEMERVANTLLYQAGIEPEGTTNFDTTAERVLVATTVKVNVLQGAFNAATRAYGYTVNVTAVNPEPNGANYSYSKFTSESIAEIKGVVQYAINYLEENNLASVAETTDANGITHYTVTASSDSSYEDQIEVDKLAFFILDEIENDSSDRLLLAKEYKLGSTFIDHFEWSYETVDGVLVATPTLANVDMFSGNYSWENLLHQKIEVEGDDNGFVLANAYYGFLDQQINTPYSEELVGVVWARAEDGTLTLITEKGTAVGAITFTDATWSNYITARNNAIDFARDKTSAAQAEVDAVAQKLYAARTALQLRSFASNTPDFVKAQEWYYKDLQKYGLTTPITHYVVNEDGTTSTYDENVFIYTGVDNVLNEETGEYEKGAVLSAIDAYWALYASKNTTADYDSIADATASRDAINGKYDESGALVENGLLQDNNVTLKKKNDASFRVGADELIANFIAGKWEDGVYDSDLIAKTDADWDGTAWKAGSQGAEIQRMLTAIEAMFTDVEVTVQFTDNADVEKCTYSTTFGNDVKTKTDELYNYTTGQNGSEGVYAQNLQFAINMRDNELYKFLGSKVGVGFQSNPNAKLVSYYYGTDNEIITINNKKYIDEYYVFDQEYIQINIKNPINDYFNQPSNWPRIYQVNGLVATAAKNAVMATVTGYTAPSTTDKTGTYEYTGTTVPEEVSDKIVAILNYVGPKSPSYAKALENDAFNTFRTEHLLWLRESAFYTDSNGYEYVLADANIAGGEKPEAYSMAWYKEGKGTGFDGKQYYLYKGDPENAPITGSSYGGWFTDDKVTSVTTVQNQTLTSLKTPFGLQSIAEIQGKKINQHTTIKNNINNISTKGWAPSLQTAFEGSIDSAQTLIDNRTGMEYAAIQALALLPATDAYREVVQLYWESQKQKGEYNSTNVGITPNSTTEIDKAIFYNADANFVTRLQDRDAGMTYETDSITGYYKGYTANLPADYNTTDADGNYTNYQSFYTNLLNEYASSATQKTIDCADEVNGAYTKENQSLKAQLIDLIAKLELTALNYEKLNSLVKAFYKNYETETEKHGLSANAADFITLHGLSGYTFYNYTMYTPESLEVVVDTMYDNNVITATLHSQSEADDYEFKIDFDADKNETGHRGTIYTNATSNEQIEGAYQAVKEAIKALKLKDADLDALDAAVNRGLAQNSEDYDVVSVEGAAAWEALQTAIKAAQDVYYVTGEDGKLVLKTGLDIRSQNDIDAKTKAINDAIANLKFKADTAAPKMTVDTTPESMRMYYNDATIAGKDAAVAQGGLPATGTFIMPVKSGYSLVVYTNELNPRIAIDLQDLGITGSPLTTKPEKLSATAQRTTGATANIITGTKFISENNVATFNGIESSVVTSSTTYSAQTYKDASASSYDDNSSLFAILAPTFSETGDQKQAVLYQLTVSDSGASQNTVQGDTTPTDNKVKEFTFANGEVVKLTNDDTAPNTVSIYVYYRNTMPEKDAEGNVNDEGIDYTGTALTAAHGGNASFVTNNIEGQKGTWQNIFGLQRSFPNIKAWELIDENKDGYVNWIYPNHIIGESTADDDSLTKGPIYYDPNFGQMNTGSFAYVLDENKAIDKAVIDEYNSVKTANGTETTDMDYAAATAAKDLLLKTMTRAHFDDIKSSNASFARFGSYQYWSQGLNGKYENGDLVFVHVVDRWGNVCNRIMQVSDYDGIAPEVNSNGAGTATIVEQGGSGLETVGIWLNGEQTAPVQTNSAAITLNATDDVTVEEGTDLVFAEGITVKENSDVNVYENADGVMVAQVSGNKFTVDGLVPGKEYQVGACDTAGNVTAPSVLADANGNVEITVVEDEEATFSLNSDIVVTINTGISSSVIDAEVEGNVIANKYIDHIIVTKDNVTQIKVVNLADNKETVYKPASTIMYDYEDGTIGWETYYKLTEGQHSYKVYAMVDGAYEEMGVTYTFDATLKTIPLSLSVVGNGKIVLEYSGAAPANVSNFKLVNIPYGAKVTIKATSLDSNSKFYYWQNDVTNRVLNVNEEMSFTAVAAVDYDAYFTNSLCTTSEYKYVVYVNNAGNVIKSVELRDGNNDYVVPLGPSLPDHEFKGWAMSKAEVIASEEDIVVVRPIYTLNAEYTVEITEGNYTVSGAGTYTAVDNQRPLVTINASAMNNAGEDFLYWIDEETKDIVSYDRAYAFNCIKNVVLTPVYGDGSSLAVEPVIRIADVRYDAASGKVSFYSERSIGEDYVLYETGIIVTRTQSIAANEDSFVLGGVSTAKGTSTSTAPYGTYSVNVSVSAQETVWARAYAVVETADGEIIEVYGDIVPYTNK